jgi:hypothetical protein
MQGFRRMRKHLKCAHCETLIAVAAYRPWLSWRLDIASYEGYQIMPMAGSLQLRIAEQRLASASPDERERAQWRVDFIRASLTEVIYDLPCPRGHQTLVTAPRIARAMRQAKGQWVTLTEVH